MWEKIGMYPVASAQLTENHMQEKRNENFWSCLSILNSIFPHSRQKGLAIPLLDSLYSETNITLHRIISSKDLLAQTIVLQHKAINYY